MSKQASAASMSERGVSIEHRRQNVSKYLLARLDRVSLTYLWQSEETLMINSLDHKSFPAMTNWRCRLGHGEGVVYK